MIDTPSTPKRSASPTIEFKTPFTTPKTSQHSDEENAHNGTPKNKERSVKRTKVGRTPLRSSFEDDADDASSTHSFWQQRIHGRNHWNDSDVESDFASSAVATSVAASSVVSVSKMRGWLDDFGKQNKAHYQKNSDIGKHPNGVTLAKPLRSKCGTQQAAMVVVKNLTTSSATDNNNKRGPTMTPVRFQHKFNKDEVMATNDGYASVQKLSAWLADEPFSDKKVTHVRKGINVISKSRMFEKDFENVIIEENDIRKGSVKEKRNLLQSGSVDEDDNEKEYAQSCVSVLDKKNWLQNAFRKDGDRPAERDVAEASVAAKKKWLEKVSSKEEKQVQTADREGVNDVRDVSNVPVTDAKKGIRNAFSKEHEKKLPEKVSSKEEKHVQSSDREGVNDVRDESNIPVTNAKKGIRNTSSKEQERDQPPVPAHAMNVKEVRNVSKQILIEKGPTEDARDDSSAADGDEHVVDFKAARQLLVKRSDKNGNPVAVLSKVQKRRQKFERMEKEMRRRSGAIGLLKPTWQQADSDIAPSTSYEKTFVEDIAPKKSFEELP